MTLSENSEIHITEFLLNDQQHRSIISLVFGKVRVLTTKLFGRADAMEVKTPNTVAGIRSSEKHVAYDDQTDRTTVLCVSGHCYIRHHHDPTKHLRVPEGHITEHAGSQFPSATRRVSLEEHRQSVSDLALTAHDPRELTTEPESPEDVDRPPRRTPHSREEDDGPPPGRREGEEPENSEGHEQPDREHSEEPPPGEEPPPPGEEPPPDETLLPRAEEPPLPGDREPSPGDEPPPLPSNGPPPLPGDGPPPLPGDGPPLGGHRHRHHCRRTV